MVSSEPIQVDLDGYIKNGKHRIYLRINGKLFQIPETISVYTAEIEGERPADLTENELFLTASSKIESPSGRLIQEHHSIIQNLLVSITPIPQTQFQKEAHKFIISPKEGTITLTMKNDRHLEAIRLIAFSEIQKQLKTFGFVHARTYSGRNPKEFLVRNSTALEVFQSGAFYYHMFDAVIFRVYCFKDKYLLLVLDTQRPILKSSKNEGNFGDLVEIYFKWVSSDYIPKSIRKTTVSIRKCNAKERYQRALNVLKDIELKTLSPQDGTIFRLKIPSVKTKYLHEPEFLFGNTSKKLKRNQEFGTFLLQNLRKHGPCNLKPLPKTIRVKILRMTQIDDRCQNRIVDGISRLKEGFNKLYRITLEIIGPGKTLLEKIIVLPESEADVEEYCRKVLREQYKKGEFDLIIGILYSDEYDHPYRRAIKKGLQDVPSQIIKHPAFNAPKIFADVYKTSIGAQIVYKSKGIIATPISPEFLENFKIRIYYDVGIKKLPGRGNETLRYFSIVGAVVMVVDNEVYFFDRSARVNDYALSETVKGNLIRELIRKSVKDYLIQRKLKAIDGPILLQRDGIYGKDEPGPALDEINTLRTEGIILPGTAWAFIEFIKDSPIRLFSHEKLMEPYRGTLFILGSDRAFLTTTGTPDIHAVSPSEEESVGVAKTLEIRLIKSSETREDFIELIAKDVYYRSFLWNATFSKTRYPVEANMVHELLDLCKQGVTELPRYIC